MSIKTSVRARKGMKKAPKAPQAMMSEKCGPRVSRIIGGKVSHST